MVGVPLYLHTVIAFAVVFLIKMSSRWAGIGVTIDPEEKIKPLIEGVISLFRSCQAGKNHILYAMADGFERLLRSNLGGNSHLLPSKARNVNAQGQVGLYAHAIGQSDGSHIQPTPSLTQQPSFSRADSYPASTPTFLSAQHNTMSPNAFTPKSNTQSHPNANGGSFDTYLSPHSQPTSTGTFGGWQTEDDMLWSMGMGYDLLATAPDAQGFLGWPTLGPQLDPM